MPTYQYECDACGYRLEMMQPMNAPKLTQCPSCKKETLQRLIGTGGGLIFKGTGFYQTDYKKAPCPAADSCPGASSQSCPASETKNSGCGCSSGCSHGTGS